MLSNMLESSGFRPAETASLEMLGVGVVLFKNPHRFPQRAALTDFHSLIDGLVVKMSLARLGN